MRILSWFPAFRLGMVVVGATLLTAADNTPTYNRDVQPILQKNCVACHAPGKVAPMSFTTVPGLITPGHLMTVGTR